MEQQISIEKVNEKVEQLSRDFEKLKEDLEFASGTEEGYIEIEEGQSTKMDFDNFIEEIKTW